MSALVQALAGTDHHPFDRMVRWMDAAASYHPQTRFIVQHGAARSPRIAQGEAFMSQERMKELIKEATVVVCHGGPGTIMDAREAGHVPLCMPRDPRLGEHVDGHQQRFVSTIGQEGLVVETSTMEDFHRELSNALIPGRRQGFSPEASSARDAARTALAVELDQLVLVRPRRLGRRSAAVKSAVS